MKVPCFQWICHWGLLEWVMVRHYKPSARTVVGRRPPRSNSEGSLKKQRSESHRTTFWSSETKSLCRSCEQCSLLLLLQNSLAACGRCCVQALDLLEEMPLGRSSRINDLFEIILRIAIVQETWKTLRFLGSTSHYPQEERCFGAETLGYLA